MPPAPNAATARPAPSQTLLPTPAPPAPAPALTPSPSILLALDATTRATGWAVFHGCAPRHTGVITIRRRPHCHDDAAARIARLLTELDGLLTQHRPAAIAVSRPAAPGAAAPALAALAAALDDWAHHAAVPLTPYPAAAVRRAIAGHPRAAPQSLAFSVMNALNLLGAGKSAPEWTALAVGAYHLYRSELHAGPGPIP